MNATEKDRDILARTLYGDGFEDQIALASTIRKRVFDGQAASWWGGICWRVPEAVAVQLLEPERPELHLPERCQADPCRAVRLGSARG